MSEEMQAPGGIKGKPANPGSKGKGKKLGKNKVALCVINEDTGTWEEKSLPAPAAAKRIAQGRAVINEGPGYCAGLTEVTEVVDETDEEV